MEISPLAKAIIFIGVVIVGIGIAVALAPKFPFLGKLPGDIRIDRDNISFYFPLTSCLLVSALLSAILWLLKK